MKKIWIYFVVMTIIINVSQLSIFAESFDITSNVNDDMAIISSNVYENIQENEKILVAIWYKDVDQEQVEEQVEKEIGISRKDLKSTLPSIGEEEISELYAYATNPTTVTQDNILEEYLSETEDIRIKEKELTDTYVSCRRKVLKDEIVKKTEEIIEETKICDAVKFESSYAPMIMAELKIDEIEEVAKNENIKEISFVDENAEVVNTTKLSLDEFKNVIGISNIHSNIGLSGNGIKVGIIENSNFVQLTNLPFPRCSNLGKVATDEHATNSALIIAGEEGVAPESNLYSINIDTNYLTEYPDSNASRYFKCVEELIDTGVDIINSSFGWATQNGYDIIDKWVDYIVENTNTIFIASAGNNEFSEEENKKNPIVLSPGKGCNVITVGGCDNKGTITVTDDIMYDYSYDDSDGVEKPDIIAHCNVTGGYPDNDYGGGTSSAAPVVSGVVALMLDLDPSLAAYPEAIKAILMASCQYKALPISGDTQETMSSGLTEKQGAGVFSPYLAICIAAQGSYGIGTLDASDLYENYLFYQPKNGATGMNVSLAWLRTNNAIETNEGFSVTEGVGKNLKLSLYKNDSATAVKVSDHSNSSAEMLYYTGLSDSIIKYKVRVSTSSATYSTSTRFAYAWCLNNEIYQKKEPYEGLYYIKNDSNGKYLTYDYSNNTYKLSTLSSTNNHQIFAVQSSTLYNVLNGYVSEGGMTYQNGSILSSNTPSEINFQNAGAGKLYVCAFVNGLYSLNAISSTDVEWQTPANATNKKWVLEKIAYRRGDVNKDGAINAADANIILQYAAQSIDLYNNEKFLADVNNDDTINSQDSLEVLNIAAGL